MRSVRLLKEMTKTKKTKTRSLHDRRGHSPQLLRMTKMSWREIPGDQVLPSGVLQDEVPLCLSILSICLAMLALVVTLTACAASAWKVISSVMPR